jgi:hypothetical protein
MAAFGLLRLLLEAGALLTLCWPLAAAMRALASRRLGMTARTWMIASRALVLAAFVLPVAGRWVVRDAGAGWAPVQVWSSPGAGGGTESVTVGSPGRTGLAPPMRSGGSLDHWALPLLGLLALGCAWRLALLLRAILTLRSHLESLPMLRSAGCVRVVVSSASAVAWSARAGRRAWVVLPSSATVGGVERRLSMAHELQHHRHGDAALAVAFEALAAVFWWNPSAGPLRRVMMSLEELACDEAVLARGSVDRVSYASCLVEAAGRMAMSDRPRAPIAALAAHSHGLLKRRILMICSANSVRRHGILTVALLIGMFGLLAAGSVAARAAVADMRVSRSEAESLAASVNGPIAVKVDDHVLAELNRLVASPRGRAFTKDALVRMQEYRPAIEQALAEKGLPTELLAVPLIESGFRNMDSSSKLPSMAPGMRGAGIWMFIPDTARHYGLRVDAANDERLDPALETRAAVTMLSELHEKYGDWLLALAAYNQGDRAVDAAIAAGNVRDASALVDMGHLNNYTATVMAGLLVLRNPALVE